MTSSTKGRSASPTSDDARSTRAGKTHAESHQPRLGYMPALDGVRAIAVSAVLLYHGNLGWFSGGFLGVDVFFVLSGYLITSVLLDARRANGGPLGLPRFYLHRARRLLPALFLMLAVTVAYTVIFLPHEAAKLRGDLFAALGYVQNWYLILHHQSYFAAAGRPPMLQHLWSLAIEEQFYLVWPLILGLVLKYLRPTRFKLALGILGGAALSSLLMAALYRSGGDPSRVYYGADTHCSGLLVGAALAILAPPWRLRGKTGRMAPVALEAAGVVGLIAMAWCFVSINEFDDALYRGGYFLFAFVAAVVVVVAVHPAARLSHGVLASRPMIWIGKRSYGIYLWHWPIYLVTRPGQDIPLTGIPLFVLRVAITFGIAAFSYRFVEMPIRNGALGRRLQAIRQSSVRDRRQSLRRLGLVGTGIIAATVLLGLGLAAAEPAGPPPGFPTKAARIPITTAPKTSNKPASPPTSAGPTTTLTPLDPNGRVTAIGDSVMLGARNALQRDIGPRLQIDADVSRHFGNGLDVIRSLHDAGQLGDEVIVHLGTNGTIPDDQFAEMMQLLSGVKRVVIVNLKVDQPWEQADNDTLAASVPRYPNAVLFDWHAIAVQHPEFFVADGVHLTNEGQAYYALVIASKL